MKLPIAALVLVPLVAGLPVAQQRTLPAGTRQAAVQERSAQTSGEQGLVAAPVCAVSIKDQANPGSCLQATSLPTTGMLFPGPHLGGVNNEQSGLNSFVGGGQDNRALAQWDAIGGGFSNTTGGYNSSTIGGGSWNAAGALYATVGGGAHNSASWYSTVGGGEFNDAQAFHSVIAGGKSNLIISNEERGGGDIARAGTIGGGQNNTAQGSNTTIAGGMGNTASGFEATIGGGRNNEAAVGATVSGGSFNTALGSHSSIAGGALNASLGSYSFAAGRRAKANHEGAFVWGDGQSVDKTSSAADEFNVYASGGARIFSNATATSGVLLAPGAGSWSSVSDRASKENLEPIDGRDVLERVCALGISTWNYTSQDDSIRHMGPMAQDFHAAFGLGVSDKVIDTIDPDGVALAAIQGLNARIDESEERLAEKDARIEQLEQRLARLEAVEGELASLKAAVQMLVQPR